ncbi:hypothetical protein RsoM2USA_282 [Ralstonia phage RsoM2USA]|nr:hypothetical protein RsoM2USA_282 [Ralstonia phage RsoM2USA]
MRLTEIQNKYEQEIKDLVANFKIGFTDMGMIQPMTEDVLRAKIHGNGVIYGLTECGIENKKTEIEIKFPIKIYEVRFIDFKEVTIKNYANWPETAALFLKRCYIAKGFGEYVQENRPTVSVSDSLVNLDDFEKILDADVMFEFRAGKELLMYSGHEYVIKGKNPDVKLTDVFELQDYLMSTDKWKTFFTQL